MDAAQVALEKAFELATKQTGQPWTPERIVEAAAQFEQFLAEPSTGDTPLHRIEQLEAAVLTLETQVADLATPARSRTLRSSRSAATSTTPPDETPIDLPVGDPPVPVDF